MGGARFGAPWAQAFRAGRRSWPWFMSARTLSDGYIYKLSEQRTTLESQAPNAYSAPTAQDEFGYLYADQGTEIEAQKKEAARRAEEKFESDLIDCTPEAVTNMLPGGAAFQRFFAGRWPHQCEDEAKAAYKAALKQIDPPDPDFGAVALPQPSAVPAPGPTCRKLHGTPARSCAGSSPRRKGTTTRSRAGAQSRARSIQR